MSTEENSEPAEVFTAETQPDAVGSESQTKKEEKPEDFGGDFLRSITKTYSEADRMRNMRALREGIFVAEEMLERVLNDYRAWRAVQIGHADNRSYEKFIRQTFDRETPELFYLLDGKACIPGYLIPVAVQEGKLPVPFFSGGLIGAADYLHMRDPALQQIDNLKAVVDNQGFRLSVETEKGEIEVTIDAVKKYAEALRNVPKLAQRYPAATQSQRGALPALVKSLRSMRPVGKGYSLLIPAAYRKNRDAHFFQAGDLFCVIQKRRLVECYGLKGKNEHQFLITEFDALKAASRGSIGAFSFDKKSRRFIGDVKVDDLRLKVEPVVFKQFVQSAPFARSLQSKMKGQHTLKDYLTEFARQITSAKRVERRDLPGHVVELAKSDTRFYLSAEFVFLFTPRSEIFACAARFKRGGKAGPRTSQKRRKSHAGKEGSASNSQRRRRSRRNRGKVQGSRGDSSASGNGRG